MDAAIRNAKIPGLREYRLDGAAINTNPVSTATYGPAVQLSTRALFGYGWSSSGGATVNGAWWPDNSVYVYTGYLWNRESTNVTWTFMENMDDTFLLRIDGNVILNKGFTTILPYRNQGNAGTHCTVTLSPGPHAIEIRAGQGGGGVGGYWTKSDGTRPVWGIDRLARHVPNVEYCEFISDPGDGSLFTVNNPYDELGIAFEPVSTVVPELPADVAEGVGDLAKGFSIIYAGSIPTVSDTILTTPSEREGDSLTASTAWPMSWSSSTARTAAGSGPPSSRPSPTAPLVFRSPGGCLGARQSPDRPPSLTPMSHLWTTWYCNIGGTRTTTTMPSRPPTPSTEVVMTVPT